MKYDVQWRSAREGVAVGGVGPALRRVINEDECLVLDFTELRILKGADLVSLIDEDKFIGHRGDKNNPSAVIIKNNGISV